MIRRPPRSTLFPTRRSSDLGGARGRAPKLKARPSRLRLATGMRAVVLAGALLLAAHARAAPRSEEHTSELQSHVNLVCRLLLEKKKKKKNKYTKTSKHTNII